MCFVGGGGGRGSGGCVNLTWDSYVIDQTWGSAEEVLSDFWDGFLCYCGGMSCSYGCVVQGGVKINKHSGLNIKHCPPARSR